MTTREAVAALLRWLLARVDPPPPTSTYVTVPPAFYTWPPLMSGACPRCGRILLPNEGHACWSVYDGTSALLPWPGSTITYTNGVSA